VHNKLSSYPHSHRQFDATASTSAQQIAFAENPDAVVSSGGFGVSRIGEPDAVVAEQRWIWSKWNRKADEECWNEQLSTISWISEAWSDVQTKRKCHHAFLPKVGDGGDRDVVTITFGTGEMSGVFVKDEICVGKICTKGNFVSATEESEEPFSLVPFDGERSTSALG
jgi:hypothetical protein